MRHRLQDFDSLPETSKLKHIYERAGFYHPVERSKYYLTRPDDDDRLGPLTPMCRENTHPREHPDSRCFATITLSTKLYQS